MLVPVRSVLAVITCLVAVQVAASQEIPDLETALASQRQAVAANPNAAGAWSDLGNLLVLQESWEEAEAAYLRAIALSPSAAEPYFNLGLLYQRRANFQAAITQFEQALVHDPDNAWAHYQLGMIYEHQGSKQRLREQAIEHYARAFELDPKLSLHTSNPQVIDSKLTTEALLKAHSERPTGDLAPMMYTGADPTKRAGSEEPPAPTEEVEPLADSEDGSGR